MKAVGLDEPLFVRRGEGAYVTTADGGRYVDWVMSFGPLIFGHADRETIEAVQQTADEGTTFGATTEREVELAAEIVDAFPSIEQVRLVSSGTEAAMSAIRLARGATKRDRILKFAGCYHGHADALLAEAGSGPATLGVPATAGVPTGATADTVVAPYNDVVAAARAVERYGEGLACVIVEPVAGNMGVVPPEPGFLETLRELCDASGALLVFDEVITGFRIARGGAQERLGVRADLTILGKVVGGGMPIGAFGGHHRSPPSAGSGRLRGARAQVRSSGGGPEGSERLPAGRRLGHALHGVRPRNKLCTSVRMRHGPLQRVLQAHARARHLRSAVTVRGDVRLDRPRGRGNRPDGGGRR